MRKALIIIFVIDAVIFALFAALFGMDGYTWKAVAYAVVSTGAFAFALFQIWAN